MGILKRPLVTEKSTKANENKTYVFEVDKKANKIDIAKAVVERYGATVVSVRTLNVLGKLKSRYTKKGIVKSQRRSYKKAYVSITEDILDV